MKLGQCRCVNCFTCIIEVTKCLPKHKELLKNLILKSSITLLNANSAIKLHTLYYLTHFMGFVLPKTLEGATFFVTPTDDRPKDIVKLFRLRSNFTQTVPRQSGKNPESNHGARRYGHFKNVMKHVNQFRFGTNGLTLSP